MQGAEVPQTYCQYGISIGEVGVQYTAWISVENQWLSSIHQFKTSMFFLCFFLNCMFYQLLRVQHSCSSTPTWGSVLPSFVETRDQNSRGCPLLFSNRNLGSFCA